jgi:Ca2+-binding RTX toxin-like protein
VTVLTSTTLALEMDAATQQVFAIEPLVTTDVVFDSDAFVQLEKAALPAQILFAADRYTPITDIFRVFDSRILTTSEGTVVATFENIGVTTNTISVLDPITQNFAEIFKGDDLIAGSPFGDLIRGFTGADSLRGRGGDDLIYGNQNDDQIYGNLGNDTLYGGQDNDAMFGGQNDDVVYGNFADDQIYGNLGDDTLYGGQDNDALFGGWGQDHLYGNKGNDTLTGGINADRFYFGNLSDQDTITDFDDGVDLIAIASNVNGSGIVSTADALAASSQVGDDVIVDLGGGHQVTIEDFSLGNLGTDDFTIF